VSDVQSFMPEPAPGEEELMGSVSSGRLVFGHTHLPFARVGPHGVELVNPGSVGMPFDGDHRAAYAVMADGVVEHRRVAYDHQASADAIRERIGEAGEQAALRVERASFET
jgi:diadenosine tetraphosphatase ApaH/serine/threonine PP2A family protein phosphatase